MDDLISRKDLIQEIEPLLTWELLAKINKMPAVDAVPVVRCKDCAYWESGENESKKWEWCTIHEIDIGPHSFCFDGCRKDGDE